MNKIQQIILSSSLLFFAAPASALDVSCDRTLQFGTLISPAANTPTVYATIPAHSDTLMVPNSNSAPNSLTRSASYLNPQRARCTVTGTPQQKFIFTVIAPNTAITYFYEKSPQTLNQMGEKIVYVGGQLNLAAIANITKDGKYNQPLKIEVTCAAENPNC